MPEGTMGPYYGGVETACGFSRGVPAGGHTWKLQFYLSCSEPVTGTRKGAMYCAVQCWVPEPDLSPFLKDHPSPPYSLPISEEKQACL